MGKKAANHRGTNRNRLEFGFLTFFLARPSAIHRDNGCLGRLDRFLHRAPEDGDVAHDDDKVKGDSHQSNP